MAIYLFGFYYDVSSSGEGKTGLTPTVDIYRSSTHAIVAADQASTEVGGGLYQLLYDTATIDDYYAVAKTTDTTVSKKHVPALAVKQVASYLDAAISTRATAADVVSTLAVSATTAATVASGSLAINTYYTFSQAVTSTSSLNLATATKVWLAIKNDVSDADDEAIVFVEKTGGLTRLNGAAYTTTTDGTLAATGSSGAWVITLGLDEAATALLSAGVYVYEIKALVSGSTYNLSSGHCAMSAGIVRAIT